MYKWDLVLNNLQWLICHKTKPINELWLLPCESSWVFFCFFKITVLGPSELNFVALRLKKLCYKDKVGYKKKTLNYRLETE